jgi:hypothetical protein
VPIPTPLFTTELPITNRFKITLRIAKIEYDEVGQYFTHLIASLKEYPTVKRTYKLQIHVLHPCKNIYKFDSASKRDGLPESTLYAGNAVDRFYNNAETLYVGGLSYKGIGA